MSSMTPKEIVKELDQFIIGQDKAKRAVAVALRNRWRRMQVDEKLRNEITPKNILMMGPTGVGKTEIARRLSNLAQAPFIKVEATKFTEVGYVGRDVESIIRDLIQIALSNIRDREFAKHASLARKLAEDRIIDSLMSKLKDSDELEALYNAKEPLGENQIREELRQAISQGRLDSHKVKFSVSAPQINLEMLSVPGLESLNDQMQKMMKSVGNLGAKKEQRTMTVKNALQTLKQDELEKMIDEDSLQAMAIEETEQRGIVFIDEIDKLARHGQSRSSDGEVSREGVQRDLLPLLEGSNVTTRYGTVKTDHILFVASGAFHFSKPSELIPELQGRLPIRVELDSLNADDFVRILSEPNTSLIKQYQALLAQEGLDIAFNKSAVKRIAELAHEINTNTENIGARRLHTVMECLLEEISFSACDLDTKKIEIDENLVNKQLADIVKDQDLSSYIL